MRAAEMIERANDGKGANGCIRRRGPLLIGGSRLASKLPDVSTVGRDGPNFQDVCRRETE